jgi:hypothetical protein
MLQLGYQRVFYQSHFKLMHSLQYSFVSLYLSHNNSWLNEIKSLFSCLFCSFTLKNDAVPQYLQNRPLAEQWDQLQRIRTGLRSSEELAEQADEEEDESTEDHNTQSTIDLSDTEEEGNVQFEENIAEGEDFSG